MPMAACKRGCVEAFKTSNFVLDHDKPELFVTSQWQRGSSCCRIAYAIYRVLMAIFWFIVIIASGVSDLGWYSPERDGVMWFIYLTNWALFILTLSALIEAITSVSAASKPSHRQQSIDSPVKMSWYLKMQWVVSNIALCLGFFVTISASVLFYSADLKIHWVDIFTHLANSIYLIINLFISAVPIRVYHAFHTMLFSAVYLVFSIMLKYSADITAYPGIDMSDPKTNAISAFAGCILSMLILWLFIYGLYRLRLLIAGDRNEGMPSEANTFTGHSYIAPVYFAHPMHTVPGQPIWLYLVSR